MNVLVIRLVCGLLFAAMVLGMVAHPPANFTQVLGMLLPASMLLGVALKGPPGGRSRFPKKRTAPAPAEPAVPAEPPRR